jgi:hypothetical protein
MNIELNEVVLDISDDVLEVAAGGAQGGPCYVQTVFQTNCNKCLPY